MWRSTFHQLPILGWILVSTGGMCCSCWFSCYEFLVFFSGLYYNVCTCSPPVYVLYMSIIGALLVSPVLGDDFLSGLSLPVMPCLVGGNGSKNTSLPSTVSHVQRLHLYPNEPQMMGLASETTVHQIRVLTEVSPMLIHNEVKMCETVGREVLSVLCWWEGYGNIWHTK